MLTEKEYLQIVTAIRKMNCPMSLNGKEGCFKNDVIEILSTYIGDEKNGR